MRIDGLKPARHIARMETEIDYDLMDEAERLAMAAFGPRAELEHIEAMYQALAWMRDAGLPTAGVATVH